MTFREKVTAEHPDKVGPTYVGGVWGCPYAYGYEDKEYYERCGSGDRCSCYDCWDREIPEEECGLKLEPINAEPTIKDSGDRTQFSTGAVRDMHEGKGRCDLLPLDVVAHMTNNPSFAYIANFQASSDIRELYKALSSSGVFHEVYTTCLEVAKHFEEGAKKYGEHNWQKGIPVNCYIDSAVRHYLKYLRGDTDERHDRAFVWNILCGIWTVKHMPELNPYVRKSEEIH